MSDHIIDQLWSYFLMLLLLIELVKSVSKDMIDHDSDAQQKHRHVESCEYFPACIFVIEIGLNLGYLNEKQFFVISVKRNCVKVAEHIPINKMTNKTD